MSFLINWLKISDFYVEKNQIVCRVNVVIIVSKVVKTIEKVAKGTLMKKAIALTFLTLLLLAVISPATHIAAQQTEWHINAGGEAYTAVDGTQFEADRLYEPGGYGLTVGRTYTYANEIAGTDDDELYQTLRSYLDFAYNYDNMENGDYDVTVYIMDPFSSAEGQRRFYIEIEDVIVEDNFDVFATTGGAFTAFKKTYTVTVDDGQLNVDFRRLLRSPFVSGVSVVASGSVEPAPEIAVSPTSLDFGDVEIGSSAELDVTITNAGTADLNITSISSNDALFSIETAVPTVIAQGASEVVTMQFAPDSEGAHVGSLDIVSDDADESTVSVALNGNGTLPPPNEPNIVVSPPTVDFGTVAPNAIYTETLTISNDGLQDLTISSLSLTNSNFGFNAPVTPFTISPNESENVLIGFYPEADGAEADLLSIESNDPDSALVTVDVNATAVTASAVAYRINAGGGNYTAVDARVFSADKAYTAGDFGYSGNVRAFTYSNDIDGTSDDTLYQSVRSNVGFSYLFDLDNGDYQVTLHFMEPFQDEVGERVFDVYMEGQLVVDDYDIFAEAGAQYTAVSKTVSVEVTDGQLNILFDNVTRAVMVAAIEVVGGEPAPPEPNIAVSESAIDFGNVEYGSSADTAVTISNIGTADLTISDITSSNSTFTVSAPTAPFTIGAGGDEEITIQFSPVVSGTQSGTVDIISNDPDMAFVSITVDGNGVEEIPTAPEITVTPANVAFGNVVPNTSADLSVTIANDGTADLTISSLTSTNALFTISGASTPFVLAEGASQEITVTFAPTEEGSQTGTLNIVSDDADESTTAVALSGDSNEPSDVPELIVFNWDREVYTNHHGFTNNTPPRENFDYTGTPNYAGGTLYYRAEIRHQPVAQQTMKLQMCYWQELNGYNFAIENCGGLKIVAGEPGNVVCWSQDVNKMWKLNGRPIDWTRPRYRVGLAIKNGADQPVSDYNGWNWNGEDPNDWYPLDMHFTAILVAEGETFSGFDDCTID